MSELTEFVRTRQIPGEPRRRWFHSDDLDLIVWCADSGSPTGFQLCYDKTRREQALTWTVRHGYEHAAVDDGESRAFGHKATPLLVGGTPFDAARVTRIFAGACARLPRDIAEFVKGKLEAYPPRTRRAG